MSDVKQTLKERGDNYGNNWSVYSNLKDVMGKHPNPLMNYAIDMILVKLSRIACGNADHLDNWHDIAGYATLVETQMKKQNGRVIDDYIV